MPEAQRYRAFTDGGAEPNPGPGGWGVVLIAPDGSERELCGGELGTTNNRMELMAALAALESTPEGNPLEIHTDSKYLQRGVTEWLAGWKRRGFERADGPLANADLWRRLDVAIAKRRIAWRWVKGHAGNRHNELADGLATRGRRELLASSGASASSTPSSELGVPSGAVAAVPTNNAYLEVSGGGGGSWTVWLEGPSVEPDTPGRRLIGANGGSSNRCDLLAALAALEACPRDLPLAIWSRSDYLRHGATQWLSGWKARGWVTKEGKPVANADLWRRLDRVLSARKVEWPKADTETPARIRRLAEALADTQTR